MTTKKATAQQENDESEVQGYCPGCDEPRIGNWIWHKPCCPYDPGDNCPPDDEELRS